jgi:hypothetical protein
MADLATHVGAAWLAAGAVAAARGLPARTVWLVAAGAALPDFLARAPHLVLESAPVQAATKGLHTPACLLPTCLLLSLLFEEKGRARVFFALWAGTILHALVDLFQVIRSGNYFWLFPLTHWSPKIEVYSGKTTVFWIPFILSAAIALEAVRRRRERSRRGGLRPPAGPRSPDGTAGADRLP